MKKKKKKKKKEEKTSVLANVLPASNIGAAVNLSLSKQDIIDMAIDEHELELEARNKASTKRLKRAKRAAEKLLSQTEEGKAVLASIPKLQTMLPAPKSE